MDDTGIDYVHLKKIDCDEKSVSRYLLQEGDVLIASKGTVKKIAVFAEQDEPVIASANITVYVLPAIFQVVISDCFWHLI